MACNQKQLKKWEWPIEEAAALFREARTDFTEKGVTDFNKIVDGLSARHNLKREFIIKGLSSPRGVSRKLTDDMWVKQQSARRVAATAKAAVRDWDKNRFIKGLDWVANAPRRVILAGHFGAFTKSHLSDQLFQNPRTYGRNFKDSWHLATKHGMALHEQRLRTEFNPTDPDVKLALRAGLNVGEGGVGKFAKETTEVTGIKKLFKGPDRASMAYDELRISRMRIFRKELDRLSPEERADIEQVKALAHVLNHDTGTTAVSNRIMKFLFLSPRLLPAQLAHTFYDIPRALFHTGMGLRYSKAAPAMRYVARKSAILASAYTGMMAVNTGIGLVTGDKRFMPNWGQEGVGKTNWLRPKVFGYSIPISPTIELLKLPVQMIAAGAAARKGDNKTLVALTRGMRTIVGRQNPLWDAVQEAIFGQDVGTGRPTPFPGITGKTEETKGHKRMGYVEYAGTKLPIPVANYVQEFYDESVAHGMHPQTALEWVKMMIVPTIELGTSYHLSPTHEPLPKVSRGASKPVSPSQALSKQIRQQQRARQQALHPAGE
jgi:hypothetical protein